jgi:tryptophan-rich sensory protein
MSLRAWIVAVPAVLAGGMASGWLSGSGYGNPWFDALAKPWFMPPGWVFPIAWTILYILMGVSLGLLVEARRRRRTAVGLFLLQLLLNYLWSPIFFGAHRTGAALAVILLLDAVVLATIWQAWRVRRAAACLLFPYAVWLALATALNLAIWRMNG